MLIALKYLFGLGFSAGVAAVAFALGAVVTLTQGWF